MKNLVLIFTLLIFFTLLHGNFVENEATTIKQPDGSSLDAFVTGDEFYHRVHDANGYTLLQHPKTGYAVYAVADGNTIKASEYVAGTVDPATLGIQPGLRKRFDSPPRMLTDQQNWMASGSKAPPVGNVHNLVVFVRFSGEDEFTSQYSAYNNMYNSVGVSSLKDFYLTQSSGLLTIDSHLYPTSTGTVISLQVSNIRGYYQPYIEDVNEDGYQTDDEGGIRHRGLISEIVALADPLVPAGVNYDINGNGVLDAFNVIYRGVPDHWGDVLWPLSWGVNEPFGTINGLEVKLILQVFEGAGSPGVVCHEMGHNIGSPDLYHYTETPPWSNIQPVGQWDIMGNGWLSFWNTYSKWKYGTWFSTIPVITPTATPTTYTLTAIDQSPYSCYKILSNDPNQFYMLEYRRKIGIYDSSVPQSGLIIYRVLSSYAGDPINGNAGGPPDEIYVYRPGGDLDSNGSPLSAAFSSTYGRSAITNYTDPDPWLYVDTGTTLDGNLQITDIGAAGGTTITFSVGNDLPSNWTGAVSTDWSVPGNWMNNTVPTPTDDVLIPVVGNGRYPSTSSADGVCKSLVIASGANLTINAHNLLVYTDMTVEGQLRFNSTGVLGVYQRMFWADNSTVNATTETGGIQCYGDMTFAEGSMAIWGNGFISFAGNTMDSKLYMYSNTVRLWTLKLMKSGGKAFTFAEESTADVMIYGDLLSYSGNISHCDYSGWIKLRGDLRNCGTAPLGSLQWDNGTLYLMGTTQAIELSNSTDHLNNVYCYSATSLESNVTINGTLQINGGVFDPASHELFAWGNIEVNEILAMTSAASKITCDGDIFWNSGSSCTATAGTIECFGNWYAYSGSSVALGVATNTYLKAYYGASILIEPANLQFGNLIISGTEEEPRFWIDPLSVATLNVAGSLTVNAENEFDISDKEVTVAGNLYLYGILEVDQGSVSLAGRPSFYAASTVNISSGSLTWSSSVIPTTTYLYGSLNMSGGIFGGTFHSLNVPTGSVNNITGGTIRCTTLNASIASTFQPAGGILEIVTPSGHTTPNLTVTNGNWLNNLKLNTTGGITLGSDLVLKGYLDLYDGNLDVTASNRTITLAGNWMNTQGEEYFDEQGGRVVFNGEEDQYITGSEVFSIIENANTGGAIRINNTAHATTCAAYDLNGGYGVEVPAGTFSASDLLDDGIYGSWSVGPQGTVNLTNSTGSVDIIGGINLYGGTINVYSGTGMSYWSMDGNTAITISAGRLNFANQGITIDDSSSLYENITGGTISCVGNFICNNPGFTPAGGLLELYGTTSSTLSHVSGANLWDLKIYKTASPTNNVVASGALLLKGSFDLRAGVFTAGGQISVAGDWSNSIGPAAFVEGTYLVLFNGTAGQVIYSNENFYSLRVNNTAANVVVNDGKTINAAYYLYVYGNLKLDPGSTLLIGPSRPCGVFSGGRLEAIGTEAAPVTISSISGTYTFTVNSGGTIAAEYTIFQYMNPNSINIVSGALVDTQHPFDYCTFQNGPAGGVYLRINNSQDLTIQGANFPEDNGGYNVLKTVDEGTVNFVNATGDFAGEDHDYDTYNRINWSGGVPQIIAISVSYDGGNAVLTWTSDPAHNNFKIYAADSPDGTFAEIGTSTVPTWSEPASQARRFYRVTAVQ